MAEASPEQLAALGVWVDQQARGRERLSVNLAAFIRRLFRSLAGGGMYDEVAVGRVAAQVAGQVRSGQLATSNLTSAYFDQAFASLGVTPQRTAGRVTLQEPLRPVDPEVQWQRPAQEYRRHIKDGLSELEAMARAEHRAETMARTDLFLAMRETSRQRLALVDDVIGYRRVIHPEKSDSGQSCGLCIAASDRIYKKSVLLPMHDWCNCEVLPILRGGEDPGRVFNDRDIKQLYQDAQEAAGGSGRQALAKVRFEIHEHGELGPVLRVAKHRFRGPRQVAAARAA